MAILLANEFRIMKSDHKTITGLLESKTGPSPNNCNVLHALIQFLIVADADFWQTTDTNILETITELCTKWLSNQFESPDCAIPTEVVDLLCKYSDRHDLLLDNIVKLNLLMTNVSDLRDDRVRSISTAMRFPTYDSLAGFQQIYIVNSLPLPSSDDLSLCLSSKTL